MAQNLYASQILAVYGDYTIPYETKNDIKLITNSDKVEFINKVNEEDPRILDKQGVYVFCIRTENGTLPWYVGQTSVSLASEALAVSKLNIYNHVLHRCVAGEPCFYFLAQRERGRQVRATYLSSIEAFMIGSAYSRNPDLANTNLTGNTWCLDAIMGGNGQKRNLKNNEFEFCEVMGIQPDFKVGINANKKK